MSDFSAFWDQQMDDPMMRRLMQETNGLLGRPQDGCKRLAEMDLDEEERVRIDRILADPRYEAAQDSIIMMVMGKSKIVRAIGACRAKRYKKLFQELRQGGLK